MSISDADAMAEGCEDWRYPVSAEMLGPLGLSSKRSGNPSTAKACGSELCVGCEFAEWETATDTGRKNPDFKLNRSGLNHARRLPTVGRRINLESP